MHKKIKNKHTSIRRYIIMNIIKLLKNKLISKRNETYTIIYLKKKKKIN